MDRRESEKWLAIAWGHCCESYCYSPTDAPLRLYTEPVSGCKPHPFIPEESGTGRGMTSEGDNNSTPVEYLHQN
jgi:hypothetical protein